MRIGAIAVALLVLGCGPEQEPDLVFPATWEADLTEVRDCRLSVEHDLEYVRLFVSPEWASHYDTCAAPGSTCTEPFGEGALFLKPQYADPACSDLVRISATLREHAVASPGPEGWRWQETTPEGRILQDGAPRVCVQCHEECDGSYDLRCAIDP
jgi:hypothetical protein